MSDKHEHFGTMAGLLGGSKRSSNTGQISPASRASAVDQALHDRLDRYVTNRTPHVAETQLFRGRSALSVILRAS